MSDLEVRCHGGISVISAFSQEYGASAAIGLELRVRFSSDDQFEGGTKETTVTMDFLNSKYSNGNVPRIAIESDIPQSQGLKSSSAFTLALVSGFVKTNGIRITSREVLRLAAQASLENGTSLTGAYDDLCSSYYGGVCLTDNRTMRLLKRLDVPAGYLAIAYNPERYRETKELEIEDMKRSGESWKPLKRMVLHGFPLEAAILNGNLVARFTGMNEEVVSYFGENGARYVSQSGKGPSIFAVFTDRKSRDEAIRHFPNGLGFRCIKTGFTNQGIRVKYL